MKVVRIVQNRAPSELSYLLTDDQNVREFIWRWMAQNPGRWVSGGSMPIIDLRHKPSSSEIPVEYPGLD
jgi:hypothetical protein